MNLPEHILDEALERLYNGEDILAIARSYGGYANEVEGLLNVAQTARQIPKLEIPIPHKQFRFAEIRTMPYWLAQFMGMFRVAAIPVALVAVVFGGNIVADAAQRSIPGGGTSSRVLYSLKRAGETARLTLTMSQEKEAALHVQYTQKRLDEVKKAINTNDQQAETAAIVALKEQSEKTFATVPQVAVANALTNQDQNLLNDLVAINKEQKDVLSAIEGGDAQTEATTALNTTKENDKTLARLIATVNEQTLIDLPNKISVTGDIISLTNSRITVEKTTFIISDATTVISIDGLQLEDSTKLTGRVTVVGTQSSQGLVARQISMLAVEAAPAPAPTVKGTTTTTTTTTVTPNTEPAPVTEPQPTNEASGSFISEPSDAQYTP